MSRRPALYKIPIETTSSKRIWAISVNAVNPLEGGEQQQQGFWDHAERTFKYFAKNTTCHGLYGLADESESTWIRVIWLLVLCGFLALTSLATYQSTLKNFVNPTFSTELVPKNFTIGAELPAIHICDSSLFNRTVLEGYGIDDEMASYLILSINVAAVNPELVNNITRVHSLKTKLDKVLRKYSLTVQALADEAILKCQDMVSSCIAHSHHYSSPDCCNMFFGNSFATLSGSCVSTHDARDKLDQYADLPHFGFVVYLRSNKKRVEFDHSILSTILTSRKGFVYSASDKIVHPAVWLLSHGHLASTGQWVSVTLTKSETDIQEILDSYIIRGTCATRFGKEYKRLVPSFKDYSLKNCWTEQIAIAASKTFNRNCTALGLPNPGNINVCHPHDSISPLIPGRHDKDDRKPFTDPISKCVEDCLYEEYGLNPSSMTLESDVKSEFDLVLHFYYDSFSYMATVRHYPSAVTWIGEVGGNMGLFLGSSIMTIIEVAVFFYHCLCKRP